MTLKRASCRDRLRAEADFDKVIELRPNETYSWMGRAKLYEKIGDQEKSGADFCKAASLDVNNRTDIRFWLARPACQPK
jgi:Tfp pilus assembly protein PilF